MSARPRDFEGGRVAAFERVRDLAARIRECLLPTLIGFHQGVDPLDAPLRSELIFPELRRRELVPALWVPTLEDRAIRERLRRRAHLVKLRTSARNRIFGLLTRFGLWISFSRLRQPDAIELLCRRGVPSVWRDSIAEHLDQIAELERRIAPIDRELSPIAGADARAQPLQTIPGVGPLIGLTFAAEIGEVSRFSSASKLVGYAGLAPRINQSGERSAPGRLSKAGPRTLRWAAVEAANQVWRPSNPFHEHYRRLAARHGKNPGEVLGGPQALDLLLAHALAKPGLSTTPCHGKLLTLSGRLTARHGIETPRQLPGTICAPSAERARKQTFAM